MQPKNKLQWWYCCRDIITKAIITKATTKDCHDFHPSWPSPPPKKKKKKKTSQQLIKK